LRDLGAEDFDRGWWWAGRTEQYSEVAHVTVERAHRLLVPSSRVPERFRPKNNPFDRE
jgi:hypothetical protein